jgi:hypothetical protein
VVLLRLEELFRESLPKTRDGLAGILSAVCAGEHRHYFAKNSIPDEIREAMNNCPRNVSMRHLVNERSFSESVNDPSNFGTKLGAEAASVRLVPQLRYSNVKFCGATDLDVEGQRSSRSSRAFTSGQGL